MMTAGPTDDACARLSEIAYEPPGPAASALALAGYDLKGIYDNRDSQAYLVKDSSDHITVMFRGTERDLGDIIHDLAAWRVKSVHGGSVHAGFHHALNYIWYDILADISRLQPFTGVTFTGHSLGGALAIMAGYRYRSGRTVAFGAPRVGGDGFAMNVRNTTLYINRCDIVPRLPRPWMGYRHGGDIMYLADDGAMHKNPHPAFVFLDALKAARFLPWRLAYMKVKDHSIRNYRSRIAG